MRNIEILKINRDNYIEFDHMVFRRMYNRDRTAEEKLLAAAADFDTTYRTLDNPNLYVFAALDTVTNCFVGWISLIYMPKIGRTRGAGYVYVDELWVEPSFRKSGIAKQLMQKADETAIATAALGIRLYVNTDNPAAQNLYTSCGYTECATACFMEKEAL